MFFVVRAALRPPGPHDLRRPLAELRAELGELRGRLAMAEREIATLKGRRLVAETTIREVLPGSR